MTPASFESFREQKIREGFDTALVRTWQPNQVNETHTHPFDTTALVVEGEFSLTVNGQTHLYRAGDSFNLERNVAHSERYGPQGAVFWAARKE